MTNTTDTTDQAQHTQPTPTWGDAVMPVAAAERQARLRRLHAHDTAADANPGPEAEVPASDPLLYVGGHPLTPDEGSLPPYTSPLPQTDAVEGNWAPLLGPGNEAMQDGSSPAPRGFTGGAMGRTVSGLSPSFPEAASGAPPMSSSPSPKEEKPRGNEFE
jgi:hypothetical protein